MVDHSLMLLLLIIIALWLRGSGANQRYTHLHGHLRGDNSTHEVIYIRNNHVVVERSGRLRGRIREGSREKTRMVVYISTPIAWVKRRTAQNRRFKMENWRRDEVVFLYVFGMRDVKQLENSVDYSSLMNEQDIEFVGTPCKDFGEDKDDPTDTGSMACKNFEVLRFIYHYFDADYVWKCDSDSYLNIRYFFEIAETELKNKEAWWFGNLRTIRQAPPRPDVDLLLERQPKLQKLYNIHQFPHYMRGGGYAFSWDVVAHIASWHIPPHFTWAEDVMMGMWLNAFQIEKISRHDLVHESNLCPQYKPCRAVIIHYLGHEALGEDDPNLSDWSYRIDNQGFFWKDLPLECHLKEKRQAKETRCGHYDSINATTLFNINMTFLGTL